MPASSEDSKYGEDMHKSSADQYNVTEVLIEEDDHDVYVFFAISTNSILTEHLGSAQSHSPSILMSPRRSTNSLSVLFLLAAF